AHTSTPGIYTLSLHDALPIFAHLRRDLVGQPEGAAGQRPILAEHRRLVDERGAERHGGAVVEDAGAEALFLEVVGQILQPLISRSEEHTSELQSRANLVCRLL